MTCSKVIKFQILIYTIDGLLELATYRHKMAANMKNSPFILYTEFHICSFSRKVDKEST